MHFFSKRAVIVGVVASLGFAGTAQAATDDTSVTLTGGAITLAAPLFGDFPGAALTGSAGSQDASVSDWGVNDLSGSGLGYEVSMAASDPSTGGGTPIVMTDAVLTVAEPVASAVDVTNASAAPTTLGGDISTGVIVANAGADAGMGDWNFAQGATDLTLDTPANARAGTYSSTITTTLTPGV